MAEYVEAARSIPVLDEVDVLVVGSGPAGFAAATSAGRLGARTMLVEQFGDIGGVSTTGMMSHWTGRTKGGIYEEILDRSCDASPEMVGKEPFFRMVINPEKLKLSYLEMLEEAGVRLRLYTFAAGVIMDGRQATGIIVESKSGRQAIMAKVLIDATGDGDIAAGAGVPFTMGRESDGRMQPMTLMFKVAGVDTDRAVFPGGFEDNIEIPAGKIQDLGREHLRHPAGHVLLYRSTLPGVVTCNMTNVIDVNGTDADDLTRAHVAARRQIEPIVQFLRNYVPGFERCYLLSAGSSIGVRETRHFQGEYALSEQDILEARVFDDWVVTYAHFNFDVHSLTGAGLDESGAQKKFPQRHGYTIPYRCLLPKNTGGLLLAGRDISGTHMAHSNFRVMPICANIGQAAGSAAFLSVRDDVALPDVDIRELQAVLLANGVLDPAPGAGDS